MKGVQSPVCSCRRQTCFLDHCSALVSYICLPVLQHPHKKYHFALKYAPHYNAYIDTCLSLKYNQQDANFSRSIYFYKLLYMFQAVPPPIIGSTKLYIQRQVLSNQYCCLLLSWMRWNQIDDDDDGRRNRLKHVEQFIEINRQRK